MSNKNDNSNEEVEPGWPFWGAFMAKNAQPTSPLGKSWRTREIRPDARITYE